jgi:hypothetical protein
MMQSHKAMLTQYAGSAGYAAAELEEAKEELRAAEEAAACATVNALKEAEIAVGMLR